MDNSTKSVSAADTLAPIRLVDSKRYSICADYTYIPELDGIRALCISLVFIAHVGLGREIPGAAFGVTTFFFLSGFLITRMLFAELRKTGVVSLPRFYIRRFWRLAPAMVTLVVVSATIYFATTGRFAHREVLAALLYLTNYYKVFAGGFELPLSILWSIAVEEHYYLVFPVVFVSVVGRWGRETLLRALVVVACGVFIWRAILVYALGAPHEYIARATDTRMDSILYGAILSVLLESNRREEWVEACSKPLFLACSAAALLATLLINDEGFRFTARFSVQGIALMVLMTGVLFGDITKPIRAVLATPLLVWLGKLSYSLYLWHSAAIRGVDYFLKNSFVLAVVLSAVGALILAVISYYGVERPFTKLRMRFGSHLAR